MQRCQQANVLKLAGDARKANDKLVDDARKANDKIQERTEAKLFALGEKRKKDEAEFRDEVLTPMLKRCIQSVDGKDETPIQYASASANKKRKTTEESQATYEPA